MDTSLSKLSIVQLTYKYFDNYDVDYSNWLDGSVVEGYGEKKKKESERRWKKGSGAERRVVKFQCNNGLGFR